MLLHVPAVLEPDTLRRIVERLDAAADDWIDGRATAGHQGAAVKRNQQIAERSKTSVELGDMVLAALERNSLFISGALPNRVYPPLFNRYSGAMHFGGHVDGAVRIMPGDGQKIRTDLSATLFLSPPESYDGGALLVEDTFGVHSVKLAAGDLIVYPASSLHRVEPVTRGTRIGCVFWIQSLVRDDARRTILFDLDRAIQSLISTGADEGARVQLTGCYHNLLRMWTDT
ncbi:MAG: Fe2+-dependent dioxygenase [Burkholderiaceae bacterium]